ncbi:LOW QUALITY PROTEIN: hypothetical protein HID58_081822 [Brassica napus]|uniref:Uncharacterized protein n=1 Tax=Brassica napus TaxID=3708 RepID=A0ABQ7YBN9_BRANA|nr:LOW QUALITY PROTEIN: hypothetical protein HID58_081822 [Brassica napus]
MAGSTLLSPFLTRRMKSKFVVTPPANVTETLLKEIPVQYGGNERDDYIKFSNEDVSEVVVKSGSSVNIEIPTSETRDLFLSLIHEQSETKASEDDTQSSKVFVKLITGAK